MKDLPLVSIIMPIRNESEFIEQSLNSVLQQDYPHEKIEIIIADGMSDDGTREILHPFLSSLSNLYLIDNHKKIIPAGLNLAIKKSKGDFIARIDGHCMVPKDYIRKCLSLFDDKEISNAGGLTEHIGKDYFSKAIAFTTRNPLVIGNSRFRYSNKAQFIDTVFPGFWKREVFEKAGLFNEELLCHEDYELNFRIRKLGGKVFFSPDIKILYYSSGNLIKLARQFFKYGYWTIRSAGIYRNILQIRQLLPFLLISLLIFSPFAIVIGGAFSEMTLAVLMIYGVYLILISLLLSLQNGMRYLPFIPSVILTVHLSHGLGILTGLIKLFFFFIKGR